MFRLINVPYTLLNPTAGMPKPRGLEVDADCGGVLNDAAVRGVGSALYSPLASGVLTDHSVAGGRAPSPGRATGHRLWGVSAQPGHGPRLAFSRPSVVTRKRCDNGYMPSNERGIIDERLLSV